MCCTETAVLHRFSRHSAGAAHSCLRDSVFWTLFSDNSSDLGGDGGGGRATVTGVRETEGTVGEGRRRRGRQGDEGRQILGNASQQDRQSNLKALSRRRTRTRKVGKDDNKTIVCYEVTDRTSLLTRSFLF